MVDKEHKEEEQALSRRPAQATIDLEVFSDIVPKGDPAYLSQHLSVYFLKLGHKAFERKQQERREVFVAIETHLVE